MIGGHPPTSPLRQLASAASAARIDTSLSIANPTCGSGRRRSQLPLTTSPAAATNLERTSIVGPPPDTTHDTLTVHHQACAPGNCPRHSP
jgi:hypothetical protein